jgi:AraC-like DNA-binding protein
MDSRRVQVAPGLVRIEQRQRVPGTEVGTDVSGPACIYAVVRIRRGTVTYLHGDARIRAPRAYAMYLPPFTVVQVSLDACDLRSDAIAFRPHAPDAPHAPVIVPVAEPFPSSAGEAVQRVRDASMRTFVGRAPEPGALAARAKAAIDRAFDAPLGIADVARRLGTSPAMLSRRFRQAFGLPPVRYRHHVRVMEALMRLAEGAAPAVVFQDVGFEDLSRFYRIFRTLTCAPPGTYRPPRSRIAKT